MVVAMVVMALGVESFGKTKGVGRDMETDSVAMVPANRKPIDPWCDSLEKAKESRVPLREEIGSLVDEGRAMKAACVLRYGSARKRCDSTLATLRASLKPLMDRSRMIDSQIEELKDRCPDYGIEHRELPLFWEIIEKRCGSADIDPIGCEDALFQVADFNWEFGRQTAGSALVAGRSNGTERCRYDFEDHLRYLVLSPVTLSRREIVLYRAAWIADACGKTGEAAMLRQVFRQQYPNSQYLDSLGKERTPIGSKKR